MHAPLLLTGATGCIGRWIARELAGRGAAFDCLVRPGSDASKLAVPARLVRGDLNAPAALAEVLAGYQAVIHVPNLAAIADVGALVRALEEAGVRRAVFLSSTGVFTQLPARTKPLRLAAECLIAGSSLEYTLLRPTLVYGDPEDGNIGRLLRFCRRSPVMPVFGSGGARQQPVHLADLAWAVAETLENPRTVRRAYNLGGAQVLSYAELVRTTYRALGRRGVLLHLPAEPAARLADAARARGLPFPVRGEQIRRLAEDKAYDIAPAERDFGYAPRAFEVGVAQAARLMTSAGGL